MYNYQKDAIISILIIAVILLTSFFLYPSIESIFSDFEQLRKAITAFGVLSPILLIFLIILQVLVAPVPGQFAGLVSGYLFGAFFGTLYSMTGLILGSLLAFILARSFGRPVVERFIKKKTLLRFDRVCANKGKITLFIVYLLPMLPDDAISYIAGLSSIRIRSLVLISAIGRLPGFIVLNIVGAGRYSLNNVIMISLVMVFLSIIVFIYHDKLENQMYRLTGAIRDKLIKYRRYY